MSKLKSIPELTKKAQTIFNTYIRKRDDGLPCISCQRFEILQAGHFVPVKNSSLLRFTEWNTNGECARCNRFDEFHVVNYRKNLIDKIGMDAVRYLEDNQRTIKKWSRSELMEIIEKYGEK